MFQNPIHSDYKIVVAVIIALVFIYNVFADTPEQDKIDQQLAIAEMKIKEQESVNKMNLVMSLADKGHNPIDIGCMLHDGDRMIISSDTCQIRARSISGKPKQDLDNRFKRKP